jgi:hypothetical protein
VQKNRRKVKSWEKWEKIYSGLSNGFTHTKLPYAYDSSMKRRLYNGDEYPIEPRAGEFCFSD